MTQASVDVTETRLYRMAPGPQARARKDIARQHYCRHFGKASPLRYIAILPDPMHAVMDIMHPVARYGIYQQACQYCSRSTHTHTHTHIRTGVSR